MRAFVIFCCIVAATQAASLGYEYERQNGGGQGSGAADHGAEQLSQPIQHGSEYSKEFYTYSAPEGEFDQGGDNSHLGDSLKKSVRVIFIKGPESNGLENAALQLAKSAGNDRTAIYVLTKQSDASDLANKLGNLHNGNANKPEVHFVKYRTQADAENAQRTIQSQYDSLGGSSTSHNGGVAPVLNFASHGPAHGGVSSSTGSLGGGASGISTNNGYLPPNLRV